MKMNKVALTVAFTAALSSASVFAATTNGQIEFQGELVNTACGLAPNSSPVIVDFGQIPVSALANGARAGNVHQNIELQHCDTTVAASAEVTYNPTSLNPTDNTLAAFTSGTASGAGIGLRDSASQDVVWGQATTAVQLVDGTNTIPFVAYVKAESASATVAAGSFQSTVNFEIAYQ
ncbi:fimbrial protein [Citrobacter rodentium]|uniref:Major fimbrial subunit n=2 Tax=Citrobacter rodentium TaxID=67825 RepID=D2TQS3_CITRI|nr:fimbrial protein [Citrobacter rodentium]KIQ49782.1 fimbrial protein [Citrobacter rodentium]QBY29863.1 type 1 fimbrial protein [Citrobacter rodentium]UHO32748.1 type 1 fimbrial protein [Citrobacter rodentium NBRC 105723 = DSM 16636]CBG90209.1 putative major fimbrial subunit [Citrobacter rodentium ICC168]HAT8014182.1 type 1 fimbrial protein [Citrobacter rodentium NBRC 105723 = DSM 16636]